MKHLVLSAWGHLPTPRTLVWVHPRGYFKKAILEAESEWSTHHAKACIETTAQKVRGNALCT